MPILIRSGALYGRCMKQESFAAGDTLNISDMGEVPAHVHPAAAGQNVAQ